MRKKRLPIFKKVPNLLKIPIFLSNIRKPIFLKKSRKLVKRFIFFNKYNYGCLDQEYKYYDFSPSSTPLIHCYQSKLKKYGSYRHNLYSLVFLCKCLKGDRGDLVEHSLPLEAVFPASIVPACEYLQPLDIEDEQDSVDQRAEMFIQRFYQEIRMQRRESF